jgi:hypothetical protein
VKRDVREGDPGGLTGGELMNMSHAVKLIDGAEVATKMSRLYEKRAA